MESDALIRALGDELASGNKTPLSGEIASRMGDIDQMHRSTMDDFVSGAKSDEPDSLFIDKNAYDKAYSQVDVDERIASDVVNWMQRKGYYDALSPEERAEIVAELQKRGGDAEFLIERAMERELDYASAPPREVPDYEDVPWAEPESPTKGDVEPRARGSEDGRSDALPDRGGAEGVEPDRGPLSEQTDAGDQLLVEGVEPVTQRQRLGAAQDAPMRGGNRAADEGLFDVSGRSQMDMFSDPSSKEAKVIHDTIASDIRTEIEKGGDFDVDMGDGKGMRPASEVLDEIEAGQEFTEIADLCGRTK